MIDDNTKAELLQLADWLEKQFGIAFPTILFSKETLLSKDGTFDPSLDGILQQHTGSGEFRIVLKSDTPNPAEMLAHEFIHYLAKKSPENPRFSERAIDAGAIGLVREFRATRSEIGGELGPSA